MSKPIFDLDPDELQEALDKESDKWAELGIGLTEETEAGWIVQLKLQAIFHLLGKSGVSEDEINDAYKKVMLADMRATTQRAEERKREMLVPSRKLLGPDGAPIKI